MRDRPREAGWGLSGSRHWSTASLPSPHPRAERSVTPKAPSGGCRDLGSGDSIPIGEGAVGPPRSGFVLRLCIRKADGAWGETALDDGLADTRFCRGCMPTEGLISGFAFCRILYPQGRGRARPHPRPRRPCGYKAEDEAASRWADFASPMGIEWPDPRPRQPPGGVLGVTPRSLARAC
jgi:hypothetical protein